MPANIIIIDGKKFMPGRFGDGKFENWISQATDLVFRDDSDEKPVLGFTSKDKLFDWAKAEGHYAEFSNQIVEIENFKKKHANIIEAEEEKLAKKEEHDLRVKTLRFNRILRQNGVFDQHGRVTDPKKVINLAKSSGYGSMIVYAGRNYGPPSLYLFPGTYFNLRWFGWNDRISSIINLSPVWQVLFQHSWFRGIRFWIPPYGHYKSLPGFDNRASSAQVC